MNESISKSEAFSLFLQKTTSRRQALKNVGGLAGLLFASQIGSGCESTNSPNESTDEPEKEPLILLVPGFLSQLYEAFFEGALLFAILWFLRIRYPNLKHGVLTGLFFVIYAFGRIFCEFFREREEESLELLSRGQFLSLFMVLIGTAFIVYGAKKGSTAPKDREEFDTREEKK